MSIPHRSIDPRRVCLISLPKIALGPRKREVLVYLSGALFAIGWWLFIDSALLSKHAIPIPDPDGTSPYDPIPVHLSLADWVPGLCSTLGMIIVNLINKEQLVEEDGGGYEGSAWRARVFLFLGFALMAGGLAGSVTVLVIKYVLPSYPESFGVNWGFANVLQSILIMASAIILWTAQSSDEEYEYNLGI